MSLKTFLGKVRRKLLRAALGRELYAKITAPSVVETKTIEIQNNINWRTDRLYNALLRTTPKATLTTVVVSLVEHCNLKCRGCDHFAPLAEESFLDSAVFERDMKRLSELSGGSIGTIKLMGGEPLLHPQKEAFFEIARRYFPQNRIELVTNGILLEKQSIDFWHSCHKNAITIVPTKYPLKIDWESIIGKAKTESVSFNFYSNEEVKTSYHIPFDIAGTRDTTEMFMHCFHANNCRELLDGRLYTCTVRPHAWHFNKVFGKNMVLSDEDSIDIHQAKDMYEILDFLAKPVPFCRYCNVHGRTFGHPWGKSSMEQNEWT